MASKGAVAKEEVTKVIKEAFGDRFLGIQDKKIYIACRENGEDIQIAISMTCPKTNVEFAAGASESDEPRSVTSGRSIPAMSDDDKKKVKELMRRLDIPFDV